MKFVMACIAGAEAAGFAEIVAEVNAKATTWTAQVPSEFQDPDEAKVRLGAFMPGDPGYEEDPVRNDFSAVELPDSFDSATQWPKCSVIANVRDQGVCGACWAFASVSSFESRACISTGRDVKYSPEQTTFCYHNRFLEMLGAGGCGGGNNAWKHFKRIGVVTGGDYLDTKGGTCRRYSLKPCHSREYKGDCHDSNETVAPSCPTSCEDGYGKSFSEDKLYAASAYSVRGEENMMKDLVKNGPLAAAFVVYKDFLAYKSGVYKHTTGGHPAGAHFVTVVGYGELDGEKYWKIKNSWGETWGDNGYFLIARGSNHCGIESFAGAGTIASSVLV